MATRTRSRATRRKAGAEEIARGAPRTGAKRTVMYYMRQLAQYLRLLGGLITDRRVSTMDKMLVVGAIAYIVMPIDFIPDFIPFSVRSQPVQRERVPRASMCTYGVRYCPLV